MDILRSQAGALCNVHIKRRDKNTWKVLEERHVKNRVTKLALLGIVRFINGEFNETSPDSISSYIPRYLALGTNRATSLNPGVTENVTVNDAKLLDEITNDSGDSLRIWIGSREYSKQESRASDPYVKLTISCYIQSNTYDGYHISEAGLFTEKTGNNCWARVTFDEITKTEMDVIDITWEITVLSVGTTVYANSIQASGPDYIELGVTESGYVNDNIVYFYLANGAHDRIGTLRYADKFYDNDILDNNGDTIYHIDSDGDITVDGDTTGNHINKNGIILTGDRQRLIVTIQPGDVTDNTVVWTSNNEEIAKVNSQGVVEARDSNLVDGEYMSCLITGITNNNLKVTYTVKVRPKDSIVYPIGVSFSNVGASGLSMTVGESFQVETTVYGSGGGQATNKSLGWSSSNTSSVLVDKNGLIYAIATGYARITCTTATNVSSEFAVTVSN